MKIKKIIFIILISSIIYLLSFDENYYDIFTTITIATTHTFIKKYTEEEYKKLTEIEKIKISNELLNDFHKYMNKNLQHSIYYISSIEHQLYNSDNKIIMKILSCTFKIKNNDKILSNLIYHEEEIKKALIQKN